MVETQLYLLVGIITALIVLPLAVIVAVHFLIPVNAPVEIEPESDAAPGFESVGDFWESLLPHLRELRDRLVWALLSVGIATSLSFWVVTTPTLFGDTLPSVLIDQFVPAGVTLQFIGAAEGFVSNMRLALVLGIAFAMPMIIYQIVAFFAPGMLPNEKRILFMSLPFVSELFLAGVMFGWFFTVPAALQFLLTFGQGERIKIQPSFESFISIVSTLMLWNGLIFEMPALIYLLAWLGVVSPQTLAQNRRYAIVIITIIAAVITPTGDPYNLLLLATPMYLLYELGILLARLVPKRTVRAT